MPKELSIKSFLATLLILPFLVCVLSTPALSIPAKAKKRSTSMRVSATVSNRCTITVTNPPAVKPVSSSSNRPTVKVKCTKGYNQSLLLNHLSIVGNQVQISRWGQVITIPTSQNSVTTVLTSQNTFTTVNF